MLKDAWKCILFSMQRIVWEDWIPAELFKKGYFFSREALSFAASDGFIQETKKFQFCHPYVFPHKMNHDRNVEKCLELYRIRQKYWYSFRGCFRGQRLEVNQFCYNLLRDVKKHFLEIILKLRRAPDLQKGNNIWHAQKIVNIELILKWRFQCHYG